MPTIFLPACRGLLFPLYATKEIGDVCTQANNFLSVQSRDNTGEMALKLQQ